MAYKVYRSTDIGAPVASIPANDSPSNLKEKIIQILDACLVNGYGTRTPAGWSKPYPDDGAYAMYKSAHGHCIRVENAYSGQGSYYNAVNIAAYESDPGSLDFPVRTEVDRPFVFTSTISISSSSSDIFLIGEARWVVYASQNSFAILLTENIAVGSPKSYLFWCGKIINVETNEIGVAQVGGGNVYKASISQHYSSLSRWKSLDNFALHQYKTPSTGTFKYADLLFGPFSSTNYPSNPIRGGSNPSTDGKLRYAPVRILDNNNGTYIGNMEGVITLEHRGLGFLNLDDTITINNQKYIVCLFNPQAFGRDYSSWTNSRKAFVLFEYEDG